MIDPLPLTRDGATPFEALLLSAGRSDAMSEHSRARIHFGLGIGGGVLAASTVATGLKATAAKSALLSTGSAVVVGALGAAAIVFAVHGFVDTRPAEVARSQPVAAAPVVPAPVAEVVMPAPAEPVTGIIEPKPALAKSYAQKAVGSVPAASLASELNAIEDARRALARRDHALALRLLDEYRERFPQQSLRSEATLLRIETLAASGATEAAHQLGKSFLANHPNGPYARRVRSLLSDAAPAAKSDR